MVSLSSLFKHWLALSYCIRQENFQYGMWSTVVFTHACIVEFSCNQPLCILCRHKWVLLGRLCRKKPYNVNIKSILAGFLIATKLFYYILNLSSVVKWCLYLLFLSTTLTNYPQLLRKVNRTPPAVMGHWLWAGVTAFTIAAGATLYHYSTVTTWLWLSLI